MGAAVGKVASRSGKAKTIKATKTKAARGLRCRRSVDEDVAIFSPRAADIPTSAKGALPAAMKDLKVKLCC